MRLGLVRRVLVAALALPGIHGSVFGQGLDTPAGVRQLADAGALALALHRVDALQPRNTDAASWFGWERLRLELLEAGSQEASIVERVRTYPDGLMLKPEASYLRLPVANAALHSGDPAQARRWLRLWFASAAVDVANFDAVQYRRARRLVIDASLAERNADAAYRAMLRYQQDFVPLAPEEAESFVAGLLRLNRNSEAANWLTQLGPRSHYAALLRMRAGLMAPDAAAAQARSALAKSADLSAMDLLEAAARAQNDRAALVEVAELRAELEASSRIVSARGGQRGNVSLWKMYEEAALQGANQTQLLVGDDNGWLSHANRIRAQQPSMARALLAHLAIKAVNERMRADARIQLLVALREARLERVAIGLFADKASIPDAGSDPRVRYLLGEISVDLGQPGEAAAHWRGLEPPAGMSTEQWRLRRLSVHAQAAQRAEVRVLLSELLDDNRTVSEEGRRLVLDTGRAAFDRAQFDIAEDVLQGLRSRAAGFERIAVSTLLAQVFEATGRLREAADAQIDAALASASPAADRDSLQARLAAARNLARSGMRDDARRIYAWVLRNAKDAGIRESAQRALITIDRRISSSPGR